MKTPKIPKGGQYSKPENMSRQTTTPISVPRTMRPIDMRAVTSLPAGKAVPVGYAGLLREDGIRPSRLRLSFEMEETAEMLMNAVHVNVQAWVVPTLALERFESRDGVDKAWAGEPPMTGADVVPFVEAAPFGAHGSNLVYKHLGIQGAPNDQVNTMLLEAYNAIHNHRLSDVSPDLRESNGRTRLQDDLAPAFWKHSAYRHIVPAFDQAIIDGEISLDIEAQRMPVKGIGVEVGTDSAETNKSVKESDGTTRTYATSRETTRPNTHIDMNAAQFPDVFVEMQQQGITVSLANIEQAKKTAAFARLRTQYNQHDDDWIIEQLMDGIRIPEQAYRQPILLNQQSTVFGMNRRYATDAGNLDKSATNGSTFVDMSLALPALNTGGVLLLIAEITPEQMFERRLDPFMHYTDWQNEWPHALRDMLDTQKVSRVQNRFVDVDHDNPDDTFGFAPLHHEWRYEFPHIGGRYYRPEVDASFDEDRQKFWAVETQNPTLGPDFYLCTTMHTKVFADSNVDPFDCMVQGGLTIEGLTQFGPRLLEATDDYDSIAAIAPDEVIDQTV